MKWMMVLWLSMVLGLAAASSAVAELFSSKRFLQQINRVSSDFEFESHVMRGFEAESEGELSISIGDFVVVRQDGQVPSVLVINKVDKAAVASVVLPKYVTETFSVVVFSTCAVQSVGLHNLEAALLKFVGMGEVNSGGRQWAVNQVQHPGAREHMMTKALSTLVLGLENKL